MSSWRRTRRAPLRALVIVLAALVVAPYWQGGDVSTTAVRASHAGASAQPALAEIDPRSDQWVACADSNTDSDADLGWFAQVRTPFVAVGRVHLGPPRFDRSPIDLLPRAPRGPPLG